MYGKRVNYYLSPLTASIQDDFNNKTLVSEYGNFILPEATHGEWASYLKYKTFCTNTTIISDTFELFDRYVPNWQQSSIVFVNNQNLEWLDTFYGNFFPFKLPVENQKRLFLWDGSTNFCFWVSVDNSTITTGFYNISQNVNWNDTRAIWRCETLSSVRVNPYWAIYDNGAIYQVGPYGIDNAVTTANTNMTLIQSNRYGDFFTGATTNYTPVRPPSDPYNGAGDSGTGGGDGTFDGSSDAVPVPSLPSIGATDTGFISLFVPSASQIRQVASYLWSNFFDLATFKKLFEDPMDCILGLSVVPVSVPTSGSAQITVGNVELSGISLPLASQQYVEVDCGTVDFTNRFFGSYLDFEPYTRMSLFVPYSGVHTVSADDIIGKVVGLKYHIDILTGSLVAFLTCGNSVLYEFNGACASNIPVNSMNYASTIENAIRIAVNIGTTVATAGAAAPLTGENVAARTAAKEFGTGVAVAGSTAEGALSLKPSIDRAGSLGGTTGLMGNQIPYFIITRPRMCKPKNQDVFQGYPSFIQTTLSDMEGTGFTAFENVILAGSYLTDTEKRELESILSAGVYL